MDNLINEMQMSYEPAYSSFLHAKARQEGFAVSGTFEITSRCNFRCKMCYIHSDKCNYKNDELPAEWWIETGKQAVKQGMVFLLITGGEPLLRDDFSLIYTELKKMGLIVSINTNGYLLKGKIAELFRNNPPFRINVSLYGASDESYERFTGVRGFTHIIENVQNMRNMGIDVRFNCSLTPDNCDDIENIFNVAKELDMHIKTTPYMYPQMRVNGIAGQNDYRLTAENAAKYRVKWSLLKYSPEEFISRADGMQKTIKMIGKENRTDNSPGKVRCRAGSSSFWLNKDGEMSACGMFDKSFDVKSLGFNEAWKQVKEFTEKIELPAKCQGCKYRHFCNVCAATCYTETGDFSSVPEYVCRFSEETARLTEIESERLKANYEN